MKKLFVIMLSMLSIMACSKKEEKNSLEKARGCDLGWLSEMENDGSVFVAADGQAGDCMQILKDEGMTAVRLRVWVNHATGWCNLPDVLQMARRVHSLGLDLMIDFHYSDYWADPQTQTIPAAWHDLNLDELCLAVAAHTTEVLETLKADGIEPRWVQIGNETTYGMLWPIAQLSRQAIHDDAQRPAGMLSRERQPGWAEYARLSNAGYEAAKQVFPNVICIVHVDNAFIPRVNWFARFQAEGGKWDMIGLSHYPFTQDTIAPMDMNTLALTDIEQLYEAYGERVMITEVGIKMWQPEAAQACMNDFCERVLACEACAGVFYWEPEVFAGWRPAEYIPLGWNAYDMGAFTDQGQVSDVLRTMLKK